MTPSPLDELHFLTEALTAHVEWSKATGGYGLPACDATWLEARREHYRNTAYVAIDEPHEPDSPQSAERASAVVTADVGAPSSEPANVASRAQPPRVSAPVARVSAAADERPRASSPAHVSPLTSAPSTLNAEVAALVGHLDPNPTPESRVPASEPPASAPPLEFMLPGAPPPKRVARPPAPAVVSPVVERPSVVAAASPEERRVQLQVLEEEVRQCKSCSLCEQRTNTVFARGDGSVGVAFVGEGPGADEDAQGYPFVGAAGQLLDKMIAAMGLDRETVYVCNIVKCRPPKNRKPTEEEMATCRPFVVSQLELIQPRVIVALGATAVEGLLGLKMGITRMRGTWRLYKGSIPVMPTFHPAYLLRQPDAKREVWEDLQAVLTRLNLPLPQRRS